MIFNIIKKDNIDLLKKFIKLNNSSFFRYYDTRDIKIIKNHIITIILVDNENIIGYGHLDFENKMWLGICVLKKYRGNGYGKNIMEYLIEYAYKKNVDYIHLTVDKNNNIAKKIYEKYNFKVIEKKKNIYLMKKILT